MKIKRILFSSLLILSSSHAQVLSFSNAYKLALQNLEEIKSLDYQLKASEERIEQVRSKLYPQISLSISQNRVDYKTKATQTEIKEESLDTNINFSQTIFNYENFKKIEYEEIKYKIDEINLKLEKQKIASELFKIYMQLVGSKNKIELLKSNLDFAKSKYDTSIKKYEMNLINKIDYLDSKIEYEKSKIEYNKEIKLYDVYKRQIIKYIKIENFQIPNINYLNYSNHDLNKLKEKVTLVSEQEIENLLILLSKSKIELAKKQLKLAKSGFYPTIDLSANYTNYDSNDITTDYENYQKIMLKLNLPLYQGGFTISKTREARNLLLSAKSDFNAEKENSIIEFNDSYTRFLASGDNLESYIEAIKSAKLYEEAIIVALDKGLKSKTELYEAKTRLNEMKQNFIDLLSETMNLYVNLSILTNRIDNINNLDKIFTEK